jgi:hypothetical protein
MSWNALTLALAHYVVMHSQPLEGLKCESKLKIAKEGGEGNLYEGLYM